jgi:NAD(P)-dependent dehydrogenase (short-subunit alcohol dehydrogenase family)
MKVVITGGGGFLGQVLAKEILTNPHLRSVDKTVKVAQLVIADIVEPKKYLIDLHSLAKDNNVNLQFIVGDVSNLEYCMSLIGTTNRSSKNYAGKGALSVFHLGAVMSGAPPDLALRVNLHGTLNMLEATRKWQESNPNSRPTFMFASAGATLGAGHSADWVSHDDTISDATRAAPHTTYGTTKACAELLMADYSRRGFCDGRGVRLPSVIVRAGEPNAATTSCFSSVVREPLSGKDVALPVGPNVFHAVTGYRSAISGMLAVHAAMPKLVDQVLGYDRTVFLPTIPVSMKQLEEAMKRVVSSDSVSKLGKVVYEEDEALSSIVASFPTKVDSKRALLLGALPPPSIDDIIREYCHDFKSALAEGVVLGEVKEEEQPSSVIQPNVNRVVALITGGGSGIGRAVAIRLAKGGWGGADGRGNDVDGTALQVGLVLVGRRKDALEVTKVLCEESSSNAVIDVLAIPTDVTKESDVQNLMNSISTHFGRVDLLFNNAGINIAPASVEEIDYTDFQRVLDTNVTACWRMAKNVMQIMSKQERHGGRIINNGSISAHTPRPGSAPYTASKHAVLGLTKCIALDGRKFNIACGQIDFGNVSSDMTKSVGGSAYSMSAGMPQANGTIMPEPTFSVEAAANTVFAMAALPLDANVLNMTVMATTMPYVGRG